MKRSPILLVLLLTYYPLFTCSIVGYLGINLCKSFIINALAKLEYRGYDSSGYACINPVNQLICIKSEGKLEKLKNKLNNTNEDGCTAIGHTRWATHGEATENNAHPHTDCNNEIAVVHNGIIENYFSIKQKLLNENHKFRSDTDTEVIAHLLEIELKKEDNLKQAALNLTQKIEGSFAILAISKKIPDTIIAIRKNSPLCIGVLKDEFFIASDYLAFSDKTNKAIFLPNESISTISKKNIEIIDFKGNELTVEVKETDIKNTIVSHLGYEHFMIKEIYEQKNIINSIANQYRENQIKNLKFAPDFIKNIKSINIIGCGTSWNAAKISKFFFEEISKVPTYIHLASEYKHMSLFPQKDSLYIAISQSGETADTLEVVRLLKSFNLPTLAVTNVASSTIAREATDYLLIQAGPEIAVAATKTFTAQIAVLYLLSHWIAIEKNLINANQLEHASNDLMSAAETMQSLIDQNYKHIEELATVHAKFQRFIFIGRHTGYPLSLEAALKLKEISYLFALGLPAGELKHGSIALIDPQTLVIFFSHLDQTIYKKLISNAQEVKARKGKLISFAFEEQNELINISDTAIILPKTTRMLESIVMSGLLQIYAYHIAKKLGCDIDKPRNLAKSVTVE